MIPIYGATVTLQDVLDHHIPLLKSYDESCETLTLSYDPPKVDF